MHKISIYIILVTVCVCLCGCSKDWENNNPLMEHIYYYGLGNVEFPKGNELVYTVEQGNTIEIPTYFFSSFTRPYSPEVFYYTSSVTSGESQLACGEDYLVVNSNGQTLNANANGGYLMIWPNAKKGSQNIYIKVLSKKKGSIRILTFDPNKQMDPTDVNSTSIVKTNDYEVRAFTENYYVSVNINSNIERPEEPEIPETPETPNDENILSFWNFEGIEPLHDLHKENVQNDNLIVSDPVDPTNKVMYVELPIGMDRKEVLWADGQWNHYFFANTNDLRNGDDFWIGFKVYVPKLKNPQQNNNPSIFQIGPISRKENFDGNYGLYQLIAPSHFAKFRWRKFQYKDYSPIGNITEHPTELNYDQWEKFVIHCSLRDNDEGLVEIWKNGNKVYTLNQANANKGTRVVIKWGVYIGVGNSSKDILSCYYDDIKIGNSESGYDAVVPK